MKWYQGEALLTGTKYSRPVLLPYGILYDIPIPLYATFLSHLPLHGASLLRASCEFIPVFPICPLVNTLHQNRITPAFHIHCHAWNGYAIAWKWKTEPSAFNFAVFTLPLSYHTIFILNISRSIPFLPTSGLRNSLPLENKWPLIHLNNGR